MKGMVDRLMVDGQAGGFSQIKQKAQDKILYNFRLNKTNKQHQPFQRNQVLSDTENSIVKIVLAFRNSCRFLTATAKPEHKTKKGQASAYVTLRRSRKTQIFEKIYKIG